MSEDASAAASDPGTESDGSTAAPGTDAEDTEAVGLLSGMLDADTDPAELARQAKHWQAQARKWEGRARTNSDAATKLKALEDAGKTDLQRAQDERDAAQRERDEARGVHSRVMAAAAHNLPVELIDYLGTGTDDEINERAEAIATAIQAQAHVIAEQLLAASRNGQPVMGARPVESLRAGSAPAAGGTPATMEDWFRSLVNSRNQ